MEKQTRDKIECCTDMIAIYHAQLVMIERLNEPKGLALPGGRLEYGESLEQCAVREFKEETGLNFSIDKQFKVYSDPSRDPRGHKVSVVFIGRAKGEIVNESGKTKVVLIDLSNLPPKENFAFDHYRILQDYLKYLKGGDDGENELG
jgi:8-oxo-dGTP diphosphatase